MGKGVHFTSQFQVTIRRYRDPAVKSTERMLGECSVGFLLFI